MGWPGDFWQRPELPVRIPTIPWDFTVRIPTKIRSLSSIYCTISMSENRQKDWPELNHVRLSCRGCLILVRIPLLTHRVPEASHWLVHKMHILAGKNWSYWVQYQWECIARNSNHVKLAISVHHCLYLLLTSFHYCIPFPLQNYPTINNHINPLWNIHTLPCGC